MEPGPALFFVAPVAAVGWVPGLALRPATELESERPAMVLVRTFWRVGFGEAGVPTEWAVWDSRKEEA